MIKPVYASLRVRGHTITGYIDDTLLVADTVQELQKSTDATSKLIARRFGFLPKL